MGSRGRPRELNGRSSIKWLRMTPEVFKAVQAEAIKERRSNALMMHILIEEALKARAGVEARKP